MAGHEHPPAPVPDAPHVLAIDDDAEILRGIELGLRHAGYRVTTSLSGEAALEVLAGTRVDLVLCDLGMPGMSGLEVIREIRRRTVSEPMPIILMTGTAPADALVDALEAGADEFITKPIKLAELVARVRAHIRTAATWSDVVRQELAARSSIVEALARVTGDGSVRSMAERALGVLGELARPRYASLHHVTGDGRLVPLATYLEGRGASGGGAAIVPARAQYLLRRLEDGAWAEHRPERMIDEPDQGFWDVGLDMVASAPIFAADQLVGALFIGVLTQPEVGVQAQRSRLHAAVVDYAGALSATLGQAIRTERDQVAERDRHAVIVSERRFETAFQPIVRLDDRTIVGHEALTRFTDGTRPDVRFVEAAAAGMGEALELAAATAAVERFEAAGASGFLAINLSPSVVESATEKLAGLLASTPTTVVIEVTENAPIVDYAHFAAVVRSIPGALLAIDDAGAGYSSMRHLVQLRPRFAKLDISLIRNIDRDPVRAALLTGLAHYALLAGIDLIAEGVERKAEAAALQELGIELAQGYLFGRPGPLPSRDCGHARTGHRSRRRGTKEGWAADGPATRLWAMNRRNLAAVLWFLAAWSGAGFVAGVAGLPSSVALVAGVLVAMIVWFDPTGRIWGQRRTTRRIRPIEEVAAELDERAGPGTAETLERSTR